MSFPFNFACILVGGPTVSIDDIRSKLRVLEKSLAFEKLVEIFFE